MQVYKSTANVIEGGKMFDDYSLVCDKFKNYREIVLNHKKPRRIELQDELTKEGDDIKYVSFPETYEGIIESHLYHYRYYVDDVLPLWKQWKNNFRANASV